MMMYSPTKVPLHKLWAQMEALVDKGLCRAIGVSNFSVQLLADLLTFCRIPPAVNQIEIHAWNANSDMIDFLMDHNIVPVA